MVQSILVKGTLFDQTPLVAEYASAESLPPEPLKHASEVVSVV